MKDVLASSSSFSLPLGTLAGTPVRVHASWTFPAAAIAVASGGAILPHAGPGPRLGAGLLFAGLLYACVLAHEFAHVAVASRHGVKARAVNLSLLGAMAVFTESLPTAGSEIAVAAAGPLASLALAASFLLAAVLTGARGGPTTEICAMLAAGNAWVGLLNLAPAYPMDGGRILYAAVWALTGRIDLARRVATGLAVAIGTAVLCAAVWKTRAGSSPFLAYSLLAIFLLVHALGEALSRRAGSAPRGVEFTGGAEVQERAGKITALL